MRPFIVIGDKTTHGGTVVGAATTATTHGKQIARVGDKVTCPKCGNNTIATGDDTMIVMGQPVARHGDKTACGATLISSQSVTLDGTGGGAQKHEGAPLVTGATAQEAIASDPQAHSLGFAFTDEATGVPLRRQPVRLAIDGQTLDTTTDDAGHVAFTYTGQKPQKVECSILGIDELFASKG